MIMTKIKKKDRKEYYQQNNQIKKSSCNDGIDKNIVFKETTKGC